MQDGSGLPFSILGFLSPLNSTTSRQNCREDQARDKDGYADELRRCEAEMMVGVGVISAEIFGERARTGVAEQISRKNLAIKFPAPEQPREKTIQTEVEQRVVDFRGMHRRGRRMEGVNGGKSDGPRQIAGAAVAAAVEQAGDAAEDAAQGDARREHVGDF